MATYPNYIQIGDSGSDVCYTTTRSSADSTNDGYYYIDGNTTAATFSYDGADSNIVWTTGNEEPETDEQRAEREQREAEWEQGRKSEEKKRKKAEKKARKLLMELISKADYRKFCEGGYVDVEGKSGRLYRIAPDREIEVFESKKKLDVAIESLCILTPNQCLVPADQIVWKKLMVEADEERLLEVANHFRN